ncbi:MAG: zinc ribbon domain-containing protein [Clostridia bacterium]|nr:zinc ribbon domain-containing protein [Clostridia bacterium]
MFCRKCGKEIPDDSNVCQYCGVAVVRNQDKNASKEVVASGVAVAEKPKKPVWKIIVPIVAVLLVIAIICGAFMIKNISNQNKFRKLIENAADKPVVEFIYDDFDKDGTDEAFAVAGEEDNEGGFKDGEVYFVNDEGANVIRDNAKGYVCGTIETDDRVYVSVEIFKDEEDHRSDVYTVVEGAPARSEISGKYETVMDVNGVITGINPTTRNVVEVDVEVVIPVSISKNNLEVTDEDLKNFDKLINIYGVNVKNYNVDAPRAHSVVYECLSVYDADKLYSCFFDESDFEKHMGDGTFYMSTGSYLYEKPDPLAKFVNNAGYIKFPADKIDWIIENVFGQQPDRDASASMWYYYDDCFYSAVSVSEEPFPIFETEYKKLPDNRYEFSSSGKYPDGTKAKYSVEGVIGLAETDGKRIWKIFEIKTFSTETGKSLMLDGGAASYLGGTFSKIFEQCGNKYDTFYYEGGDFIYYPEAYPMVGFCPSYVEGEGGQEMKDKIVKYILAWDTTHLYKDLYADMSYNELKDIVPEISRPQYTDYDGSYYISFELDGYHFTYTWFDEPDDNTKCAEVMLSSATD